MEQHNAGTATSRQWPASGVGGVGARRGLFQGGGRLGDGGVSGCAQPDRFKQRHHPVLQLAVLNFSAGAVYTPTVRPSETNQHRFVERAEARIRGRRRLRMPNSAAAGRPRAFAHLEQRSKHVARRS